MQEITDEKSLAQAFEAPRFLLFKHSTVCPVSAYAHRQVVAFEANHADLPIGWVDVRAKSALSGAVAERTGVEHESPQAFLLRAGEVIWHDHHYGIREADLEAALAGA